MWGGGEEMDRRLGAPFGSYNPDTEIDELNSTGQDLGVGRMRRE